MDDLDSLSNLPDSLIFQILLNLPTKDVVKTSVFSSRWRNLWRYVPGLDLGYDEFPEHNTFVSFVDRFLGFSSGSSSSYLQNFKLQYRSLELNYEWEWNEPDIAHVTRWINTVIKRKVQHLHVKQRMWGRHELQIPPTIYTCESLVSLKLCDMTLVNPKSVSLPFLKVIDLDTVTFANDWAFEMLILGCPVLETLSLRRSSCDNIKVLRVCSQSLLSLTHGNVGEEDDNDGLVVAIDAPKLEYLNLLDCETNSFTINNPVSLVKVDIDVTFNLSLTKRFNPNDLPKRDMIRNFLIAISRVKNMVISSCTLEVIYNYSRCEQLPVFRNLFSLDVTFHDYRWESLPIFLESCLNLKSLTLVFHESPREDGVSIVPGPPRFLPSLEFVKIVKPMVDEETEMNLVSYFLENSTILKEFTFCLGDFRNNQESSILKKLLAIPRLSSSCKVFIL